MQGDSGQNPQPSNGTSSVPRTADQQVTMISVPAGGLDDGQKIVPYTQHVQPATSDAELGVGSAITQTCDGTVTGEEEPAGLVRSDTEAIVPSVDKEVPITAKAEDQSEPEDRPNKKIRPKAANQKLMTNSTRSSACLVA